MRSPAPPTEAAALPVRRAEARRTLAEPWWHPAGVQNATTKERRNDKKRRGRHRRLQETAPGAPISPGAKREPERAHQGSASVLAMCVRMLADAEDDEA